VDEKCIDDPKNLPDLRRLGIRSIETVDGRSFVQFGALLFMSGLRRRMRATKLIEKYTVRELLLALDPLTKIHYALFEMGRTHVRRGGRDGDAG
jgi:hypothetical protein